MTFLSCVADCSQRCFLAREALLAHPEWSTLCRPRRHDLVDLPREADGLFEGHHDLAIVGHVVVKEGASLALLEPPLQQSAAPDVELLHLRPHALEVLGPTHGEPTARGNALCLISSGLDTPAGLRYSGFKVGEAATNEFIMPRNVVGARDIRR
jgi:hypothetical protein